jgi:hypothetical protein
MGFEMKGSTFYGKSPLKQEKVVIDGKTYPKGYTKKDVEFLKSQNEDIVRRSDFDEGSEQQKMFDRNQAENQKSTDKRMSKTRKELAYKNTPMQEERERKRKNLKK